MIGVRKANDRGVANFGWLDSRHTFSFGDYHDPRFMGFSDLRVINDDRIAGGGGFPTHPHRDMEIVTYVIDGALAHKDSLGNGAVIRPGEVQRMTAGTGIRHSEYNESPSEPVRLLQIWMLPESAGLTPGYEQKEFPDVVRRNKLALVGSRDGREGSVTIHQDLSLYAGLLDKDAAVEHVLAPGRRSWLQVARGAVELNGVALGEGDGAATKDETRLAIRATEPADLLLFDLR
jgi:redox-sensitive bicupin YhaK (pirin superfamily)